MPTYQYACKECGHRFETVQAFSDASLTECPQCNGNLRKVFNSVGVVFKGSGFYRTDSRNESKSEVSSGSESKDGSGGKDSGKDGKDVKVKSESKETSTSSSSSESSKSSSDSGSSGSTTSATQKSSSTSSTTKTGTPSRAAS